MKKMLKSLFAVAVLATAFTACSKDDAESAENTPREVKMTVVAGSDLEVDGKSRTVLDPETNKISWNTSGEYLKVFETAGATTSAATSAEGVITSGKAAFGVSFTENTTATSFTYNAIYPASAWVDGENTDVAALKVITPSAQKPSATSFDGAADLLIAFPETSATQPQTLNVRFKRIVAIGKMTIKNLNSTENITSIQFQAANKTVTGRSKVDLNNGTVTEYGYTAVDNVVLNYASSLGMKTGMTAYFTCFPFELVAGESFTVTVTTPSKIFTRTVTLPEGRTLAFTAGNSSSFNVDMATATEEVNNTLDGEYVIVANQSGIYYAMSSAADGDRLAPTTITYDGTSEFFQTNDATIIWTITKTGDNYTITNNSGYLMWQGLDDKGKGINGATTSSTEYALKITKDKTGNTYQIASVETPTRILAKNAASNTLGFGFYAGTQTKDLLLIKVGADPRTPLATPANLEAIAVGNEVVASWNAVTGTKNYTVTCGDQSQTVTEVTATFTMAYSTEYTVTVVANPADDTVNKASEAATTIVTTEANPNPVAEFDMTKNANFTATSDLIGEAAYYYDNTLSPNIGLVFDKGAGDKNPYFYNGGNHQLYAGNTLTIEGKTITGVEFTTNEVQTGFGTLSASEGSITDKVWSGSSNKVTFTAVNGWTRITKIVVTYDKASTAVFTPAIASVEPAFTAFTASDYTAQTAAVKAMNAEGLTLTANTLTNFNVTIDGMNVTVVPKAANTTDMAIEETLTLTIGSATYSTVITQLAAGAVAEKTVTFDMTAIKAVTGTVDEISYVFANDGGSTKPTYNTNSKEVRMYAKNKLTISGATITKIEITFKSTTNPISANIGTWESPIWTGSANKVILTTGGTKGHEKITTITVTYY